MTVTRPNQNTTKEKGLLQRAEEHVRDGMPNTLTHTITHFLVISQTRPCSRHQITVVLLEAVEDCGVLQLTLQRDGKTVIFLNVSDSVQLGEVFPKSRSSQFERSGVKLSHSAHLGFFRTSIYRVKPRFYEVGRDVPNEIICIILS